VASQAHNDGRGQRDCMPHWFSPIVIRVKHELVSSTKARDVRTSKIAHIVERQQPRTPSKDSFEPLIALSSTGCKRWDTIYARLHTRCCHGNWKLATTGVTAGVHQTTLRRDQIFHEEFHGVWSLEESLSIVPIQRSASRGEPGRLRLPDSRACL
jgi:hypothetical protein